MTGRTALWTLLALLGFAANSLLCRAALASGGAAIDAGSFTALRLGSGALVLHLLLRARRGDVRAGSWKSALALFVYAAGFSLAYLRIGAAVGALILFGFVQLTMLGSGVLRGERPKVHEWLGMTIAFTGLVVLTAPGVTAPDLPGAALMTAAGIAWGVYSLRGKGSRDPLAITAGNFARTLPLAAVFLALTPFIGSGAHATPRGITLAVASGALASGVGYSLWYAALPSLGSTRAAIVQLAVPVVAAAGAVLLLDEPLSWRLVIATLALLGGVSLALFWKPAAVRR